MYMLDVLAQYIYSLLRRLTEESVRMMHIPKSGNLMASDLIKNLLKEIAKSAIFFRCLIKLF